jgi:hypothetical protein
MLVTTLLPSAVLGSQKPRVRSGPEYQFTSGPDAVEIYETTGMVLDQWQRESLDDHCAENPNGSWVTIESAEECSRQNGKGEIINALFLLHLFVLGTKTSIYSAHEFKTAKETYEKISSLIKNTPELDAKVRNYYNSNENTSIVLKSGQKLRFLTRSKDGGRGFTGDIIIFDEAFNITSSAISAIMPTLSSKPNPHIYFFSSAGKASSESDVLRRLKARGEKGDTSLFWRSFSADPDADTDSLDALVAANPGLGTRITERFVAVERENMGEAEFRRERLGIWEVAGSSGSLIQADAWAASEMPAATAPDDTPLVVGVAVSPDRSWASVGLAAMQADGSTYVEVIADAEGVDWLEQYLVEFNEDFTPQSFVIDQAGPAATLLSSFINAGLNFRVTGTPDYKAACAGFVDGVKYNRIRHRGQAPLTEAALGVKEHRVGDSWVYARRDSGVRVSPLEAVTLAVWGLVPEASKKEFSMFDLNSIDLSVQ